MELSFQAVACDSCQADIQSDTKREEGVKKSEQRGRKGQCSHWDAFRPLVTVWKTVGDCAYKNFILGNVNNQPVIWSSYRFRSQKSFPQTLWPQKPREITYSLQYRSSRTTIVIATVIASNKWPLKGVRSILIKSPMLEMSSFTAVINIFTPSWKVWIRRAWLFWVTDRCFFRSSTLLATTLIFNPFTTITVRLFLF